MRKQMKVIMTIISIGIMLFMASSLVYANGETNFSVILTTSTSKVKRGETVDVIVELGEFNNIGKGINSFLGDFEYDKTKLSVESSQIVSQNGWDTPTYENNKILTTKGSMVTKKEAIIKMTFTVNSDAEYGTTTIKIKNAEASNDENDFIGADGTISLEIVEETTPPAGDTECEHTYGNYTDSKDGKHSATCSKCGEEHTESHTYKDGVCSVCGAKENVESKCEHTYGNYTDSKDGKHSATCSKCGEKHTESHTYKDGVCSVCGAKENVETKCEHTYGKYTDNKDGKHSATCSKCGEKHTEEHIYINGVCSACGAKQSSSNEKGDTADKEYPKAGLNVVLIVSILAVVIVAVAIYKKNQKYKDII